MSAPVDWTSWNLDDVPLTVEQRILAEDYAAGKVDDTTRAALDFGALLGIRLGAVVVDTTERLIAAAKIHGHDPRADLDAVAGLLESLARTIRNDQGATPR